MTDDDIFDQMYSDEEQREKDDKLRKEVGDEKFDEIRYGIKPNKTIIVKKTRTNIFDIDVNKTIKVDIEVERNGYDVVISTRIGNEPWVRRTTTIFNPLVVKDDGGK